MVGVRMPDRDSPADLMRNFTRARYGRMEPECRCIFHGDFVDVRWCELHNGDCGDELEVQEPIRCLERWRIIEAAETVGEMVDRVRAHKLECRECGGGSAELPKAA